MVVTRVLLLPDISLRTTRDCSIFEMTTRLDTSLGKSWMEYRFFDSCMSGIITGAGGLLRN
ncbi:hypothetical protein C470_00235 [Halorubrum distributum JCM 13561]|uniref:Uncharacterized protein n=1 Tax=Halorubrum distributum JCM 13561 TaxID=1227483 RepID=M0P5Q6_9EURY|nr:hypothetical protein C470_00235 [Halorubrum litoreum JCM 13561]